VKDSISKMDQNRISLILIAFVVAVVLTLPGMHGLKCRTKDTENPKIAGGNENCTDVANKETVCVSSASFYNTSTIKTDTIERGCKNLEANANCTMEISEKACKKEGDLWKCEYCCKTDDCNTFEFVYDNFINGANTVSITMGMLSLTILAVIKTMH
jgi:hypothetical protein